MPVSFQLKPNVNHLHPEHTSTLLFLKDLPQNVHAETQMRLIAVALKSIGEGVAITNTNWVGGHARILYESPRWRA